MNVKCSHSATCGAKVIVDKEKKTTSAPCDHMLEHVHTQACNNGTCLRVCPASVSCLSTAPAPVEVVTPVEAPEGWDKVEA